MPADDHPQHETHGEAFAVCWVVAPRYERAEQVAREWLEGERLLILDMEYGHRVTRADYPPGDDEFRYYEEAQVHGGVYVLHTSPRFPVYRVVAAVSRSEETAEAHYLVTGEFVMQDGEDLYDPRFWSAERAEAARRAARRIIEGDGWTFTRVVTEGPVSSRLMEEDLREFYDHAEEDGECVVFVRDERWRGRGD